MAIVTRKEFASMCNKTSQYIGTNVNRRKLIEVNKTLDTENPLNKSFLKKWQNTPTKTRTKNKNVNNIDLFSKPEIPYTAPESEETIAERELSNRESAITDSLNLRKQRADTIKAERSAEMEQIKVDKLAGKLIPFDLAQQIFKVNIQSIFVSIHTDLDNLGSIYCDILAGGDRKKLGEIMEKIGEYLESAIGKAESTAALEIKNVISKYAESRARGERK